MMVASATWSILSHVTAYLCDNQCGSVHAWHTFLSILHTQSHTHTHIPLYSMVTDVFYFFSLLFLYRHLYAFITFLTKFSSQCATWKHILYADHLSHVIHEFKNSPIKIMSRHHGLMVFTPLFSSRQNKNKFTCLTIPKQGRRILWDLCLSR